MRGQFTAGKIQNHSPAKIEEIIKKIKKIETFNNVQKKITSKLKKGIWVTGVMPIANKKK